MKTRRYGPLRGPNSSSCGELRPLAEAKNELIMLFWTIFGNFWCLVVTLVPFSSNCCNFERNPEEEKKSIENQFFSCNFQPK